MRLYSRKEGSMEERIRKENEIIKGNQMILYRNLNIRNYLTMYAHFWHPKKATTARMPMPAPIVSLNWQ